MTTKKFFDEADLLRASEKLKSYYEWDIFTHMKADGDAIGSATALYELGIKSGHRVEWFSPDSNLPLGFKFLPHYWRHTRAENFNFVEDNRKLYVFLDCSNEIRSVGGYDVNAKLENTLNIDHHEDNSFYADINCVDGVASSTCEMLYRVFTAGGWEISRKVAESLYTGIFTDTGSFSFSNVSPRTHNIAGELIALGVDPGHMTDLITQNKSQAGLVVWAKAMSRAKIFGPDGIFALSKLSTRDFTSAGANMTETEGLPSMLMSVMGVKFAAILTENFSGDIRVSFRSREGAPFGAGEFARTFGGGGHERAAGATLKGTLDECASRIEALLMQKYHECSCSD